MRLQLEDASASHHELIYVLAQQLTRELTCSLHFSSCVYWHWPNSYFVRANSSSGQNPHRYGLHTSLSVKERFGLRQQSQTKYGDCSEVGVGEGVGVADWRSATGPYREITLAFAAPQHRGYGLIP